jgi:hypothetical protein
MVALFKDNLTGQRFTRWTVLGRGTKPRHWLCICVCGATREVVGTNLRNGYSRSCGCLPKKHSDPKEEVNQRLVVQPIKVGESSAVMAAFRASQIEGKSAPECYLAAVKVIQILYPECSRQYAGKRAVEIILESRMGILTGCPIS